MYGTELLLIEAKIRRSRFKQLTAKSLLGNAAVIVAISAWTAELAQRVLALLDLKIPVHTVPLGTTPSHFRPGIDARGVRAKYGLNGGPWLLTVARLEWHKGIDTVMRAFGHDVTYTEALIGGVASVLAAEGIHLSDSTALLKPLLAEEGAWTFEQRQL